MQLLQAAAVAVSALHLLLLLSAYVAHDSFATGAFVSTHMESHFYFRVSLTLLVFLEQAAGATYAYAHPVYSETSKALTLLCLATALTGWLVLAAFPEGTWEHLAGTAAYTTATSIYTLLFIFGASACRALLLVFWTVFTSAAVAFASLHYAKCYREAATAEWVAFSFYACTLLVFFWANPPPQEDNSLQSNHKERHSLQSNHKERPENTWPLLQLDLSPRAFEH